MRQTKRFSYNVLLTFLAKGSIFLIGLATSILTARALGPHDRGIYSLLFTLPQTMALFLRFGIPQANIYLIRREKVDLGYISIHSIFYAVFFGLSIILVFVTIKAYSNILSSIEIDFPYMIFSILTIPFYLLNAHFSSICNALERFNITNAIDVLSSILLFSGVFFSLVVLKYGLYGAVIATVLVTIITSLCIVFGGLKMTGIKSHFALPLIKRTFTFGVKSYVQTIVQHLHLRVDMYMIALFLRPDEIAYYSIASRLAELLLMIEHSVGVVFYTKLSAIEVESIHEATAVVLRHVCMLASISAVTLFLIGKPLIILWYGGEYMPAILPFMIIIPGIVMLTIFYTIGHYFTSRNKQEVNSICGMAALVINILLNIWLIKKMGISGAALSSTISYSVAAISLFIFFLRAARISFSKVVCFTRNDLMFYINMIKILKRNVICV